MENINYVRNCVALHLANNLDLGFNTFSFTAGDLVKEFEGITTVEGVANAAFEFFKKNLANPQGIQLRKTHYIDNGYIAELEKELLKTTEGPDVAKLSDWLYKTSTSILIAFRNLIQKITTNIIVTDIETTGLSGWLYKEGVFGQEKHPVIQIAVKICDEFLNPKAEPLELTIHHSKEAIEAVIDPYVRDKMHGPSGLLDKVYASTLTPEEAEVKLIRYLEDNGVPRNNMRQNIYTIMAGNSIHTDYAFLNRQYGRFTNYLSHQLLDFSAIQLAAKITERNDLLTAKEYGHTALADVEESIVEGKKYFEFLRSTKVNTVTEINPDINKFK